MSPLQQTMVVLAFMDLHRERARERESRHRHSTAEIDALAAPYWGWVDFRRSLSTRAGAAWARLRPRAAGLPAASPQAAAEAR